MSCINDNTKKRKMEHLNYEERKIIERLIREKCSKGEIAKLLHRDKSTIKREIKRGSVEQREKVHTTSKKIDIPLEKTVMKYFADVGQRRYENNRQRCGAKNKVIQCSKLVNYVEALLFSKMKWSPDTSIGYAKRKNLFDNMVTTQTFYNWIESGLVGIKNIDLPLKVRRKPKSKPKERKRVLGKSIDERPKKVEEREEFGHWEGDGIVGKKHKGQLITLVERKSGMGLIFNVLDRKEDKIVAIFDELESKLGENFKKIFKTITFDNGSEFSASDKIEKDGRIEAYYAHPYSSWERGINENYNGLVRRFIPKGSSFASLKDKDISRIMNYINTMPRKRSGYKSPLELWKEELSALLV